VTVRHKLGYGKPAGLGSVELRLQRVELDTSPADRYRSFRVAPMAYEAGTEALAAWVRE